MSPDFLLNATETELVTIHDRYPIIHASFTGRLTECWVNLATDTVTIRVDGYEYVIDPLDNGMIEFAYTQVDSDESTSSRSKVSEQFLNWIDYLETQIPYEFNITRDLINGIHRIS